jgi:hypothetical protein
MKKIIQLVLLFFICFFINACKKQEAAPVYNDQPVIESYLQVGSPARVKVGKLVPFDSTDAQYSQDNMNALNVKIICNNIIHPLHSIGGGVYIDSSLIINDSSHYLLQFDYNGKVVSAITHALSKPQGYTQSAANISITQIALGASGFGSGFGSTQPDPIILNWSNPDHTYYIVLVQNIETNPELINLNNANEPIRIFRSEPTQDIISQINARQFRYYGMHKIILYHVLPDYADLYKNNSTSSQNLTVPTTSINNGLGIFTAINSTTLYVNVHKQ